MTSSAGTVANPQPCRHNRRDVPVAALFLKGRVPGEESKRLAAASLQRSVRLHEGLGERSRHRGGLLQFPLVFA